MSIRSILLPLSQIATSYIRRFFLDCVIVMASSDLGRLLLLRCPEVSGGSTSFGSSAPRI